MPIRINAMYTQVGDIVYPDKQVVATQELGYGYDGIRLTYADGSEERFGISSSILVMREADSDEGATDDTPGRWTFSD